MPVYRLDRDPVRHLKPLICKHSMAIWPWRAEVTGWAREYECPQCCKTLLTAKEWERIAGEESLRQLTQLAKTRSRIN